MAKGPKRLPQSRHLTMRLDEAMYARVQQHAETLARAQTRNVLGPASLFQIVEMLAASKPEQARELSEILAGDPSSKS